MRSGTLVKKIIPPVIPYLIVIFGLVVFHNAWLAILTYHAGMLIVLLLAKEKLSLKRVFENRKYFIVLAGSLAGAAGGSLFYFVWPWLGLNGDISSYTRSIGLTSAIWPGFLAYFVLVNPVIEEYYWRGFLAGGQKGISLNDVWFSGYHLLVLAGLISPLWLVVVFISLTFAAWFWRQINCRNGGLLASMVSHLAADVAVMFTILAMSVNSF